jgi:hypothetical protein
MSHPFPAAAARLRQRIARRYVLKETAFTFGELVVPFTRVADPDRVLDEVAEEEDRLERVSGVRAPADQLHLPYWAELWDSAIGMGQWLADRGWWGVGSDGVGSEEVKVAKSSLQTSSSTPQFPRRHTPLPALLFARLNSLPWGERVRTRRLNWQTDRLDERFDLILGADILYERKQWDFLEPFCRAHVAQDGSVLLGEPGRQTGDLFTDWIASRGWTLTQHAQRVDTREQPIRLFELRLENRMRDNRGGAEDAEERKGK